MLDLGHRVVNWCPRCETAIADAEVEYWDERDPSVFVKFPLAEEENEFLVIWTTTPWTLPANVAVAVDPALSYALVRATKEGVCRAALDCRGPGRARPEARPVQGLRGARDPGRGRTRRDRVPLAPRGPGRDPADHAPQCGRGRLRHAREHRARPHRARPRLGRLSGRRPRGPPVPLPGRRGRRLHEPRPARSRAGRSARRTSTCSRPSATTCSRGPRSSTATATAGAARPRSSSARPRSGSSGSPR